MEYGLLFKKTSTCYSNPDIEYLDETSDYKLRVKAKGSGVPVAVLKDRCEQVWRSVGYISKEDYGRVYAGGFLRSALLEKKALAPEKWDNEVRKKAITAAIFRNVREFGAYRGGMGHKLVFSMSKELEEAVLGADLNPDELLGKEVKKVMYLFQKRFHRGERIGFAWGIHHDTDHRHVHVYLCNRTDKGRHVAMSCPLKDRRSRYKQKDQMGYVKAELVKAQARILRRVQQVHCNEAVGVRAVRAVQEVVVPDVAGDDDKEAERLALMRRELVEQENALKMQQELIRRMYTDFNLQKALAAAGYDDVRKLNREIALGYKRLRECDTVVTERALKGLGIIPDKGPMRSFVRALFALHRSQRRTERQALFDRVQADREVKNKLLNQLKVMDWQRRGFVKGVGELKEERAVMQRRYFECRDRYEKALLRHNYDVYMKAVSDKGKQDRYYEATRRLWVKRRRKEDSSAELALIRKLDGEVRVVLSKEVKKKVSLSEGIEIEQDSGFKKKL